MPAGQLETWLSGFIELLKSAKEKEEKLGSNVTKGFTPFLLALSESKTTKAATKITKVGKGKSSHIDDVPRRTGGWSTIQVR